MSAVDAARRLLGCELVRATDDGCIRVRIVETEAYDQTDEASHTFTGKTKRNEVMFGRAGHLYVYFTYGMHYCCNVVVGEEGFGAAVLIRAVQPLLGADIMKRYRGRQTSKDLANGPAKLCQALAIDTSLNGHDLAMMPCVLELKTPVESEKIVASTRIGISRATDKLWRFNLVE